MIKISNTTYIVTLKRNLGYCCYKTLHICFFLDSSCFVFLLLLILQTVTVDQNVWICNWLLIVKILSNDDDDECNFFLRVRKLLTLFPFVIQAYTNPSFRIVLLICWVSFLSVNYILSTSSFVIGTFFCSRISRYR